MFKVEAKMSVQNNSYILIHCYINGNFQWFRNSENTTETNNGGRNQKNCKTCEKNMRSGRFLSHCKVPLLFLKLFWVTHISDSCSQLSHHYLVQSGWETPGGALQPVSLSATSKLDTRVFLADNF